MNNPLTNYIQLLGRVIKDRVTHFEGTAVGLTFDLYGCIQVAVQPKIDKDGKIPDGRWLDVNRLEPVGDERTMPIPDFSPDAPSIATLGRWGRDRVTSFEGTVSSIAFQLSGKTEIVLSPRIDKDGKIPDGKWIDASRVSLIGEEHAMAAPTFTQAPGALAPEPREHTHGPAEKPTGTII